MVVANFALALHGWLSIRRYTDSLAEDGVPREGAASGH